MKHLTLVFCLALGFAGVTTLHAQESNDRAFGRAASGVYLLTQNDGHLRLLTLNRDGTASQISPQQTPDRVTGTSELFPISWLAAIARSVGRTSSSDR